MKLVCISDTHEQHNAVIVPDGDVLLFAGDFSYKGDLLALERFNKWLGTLPHKYKIVVAGNHDFCFERKPDVSKEMLTNAVYLQDEGMMINGVKFYGSPWQPWFHNWAFNLQRGCEILKKWKMIPFTDVLITHGPPRGILDQSLPNSDHLGCDDLLDELGRVSPKVHLFGHIHGGYGITRLVGTGDCTFVNASICDESYKPVNKPIVVEI